ncbi:hypothetical protein F443_08672 [Phytophthora nicotianae P1569]|uniref:Uncharacterized protein n=1 Tax=Phytophthora nicotianae P1569 TaxID=1317065 RepID=V9F7K8_PHYNI|nr:hypothetical protein F443_08672 [Phytophthora nicotianae P1569]
MIRSVTTASVVVVEKQVSTKKAEEERRDRCYREETKKKKTVKMPEEIAEADTFAKELFKLGPDYSTKVLIGIDPGMRSFALGSDERFPILQRIFEEAGAGYAAVTREMPSFKTASYDAYFDRFLFFWKHVRFLLALSAKQAFLQWRFTQDRAKMKALDTLAQRLVPNASKQVCIAYGDWSRRGGIKGHPTGPVIGLSKR